MSVRIMSIVFDFDMPDLKTDTEANVPDSTAKFVLLALADHCNDEGEGAYPSIEKLCKKTSMSKATVCNAVNALRHNGFTNYEGFSKLGTKNYTISVAKLLKSPEVQPLKSKNSSHRNPGSSAAEMESSINHQLNRERGAPALDFKNMNVSQARKLPTLKLYAEATDFFPGSILWEYVHHTILENRLTFEKIHAAAVEWGARGYKPENVKGVLEWAVNGIPRNGKSSQPLPEPPANAVDPFASLKESLARREAGK